MPYTPRHSAYSREVFQAGACVLPKNFIEQLPEAFPRLGHIIHNARNQIRVFEWESGPINIKKYCIPPIVNRILYSLGWRTPKAQTTFQNALEIIRRGFRTPQPLGYIIERQGGLINYSYFISEQLQGFQTLRLREADWDGLIKALARYTVQLHQAGLRHKDYTPGNILYTEKDGQFHFALVDINRFRIYQKPVGLWAALTNLMQPFENDEHLKLFVSEYAKLRQINRSFCTAYVLFLRHMRNAYNKTKRALKKIPGANLLLGKPLGK